MGKNYFVGAKKTLILCQGLPLFLYHFKKLLSSSWLPVDVSVGTALTDTPLLNQDDRGGNSSQPVMKISQAEKDMQACLHVHHQ